MAWLEVRRFFSASCAVGIAQATRNEARTRLVRLVRRLDQLLHHPTGPIRAKSVEQRPGRAKK
jgi:hypothetical protein